MESQSYPLGIVGEASYQPAIRTCSRGQCVQIVHEPDNPYDNLALAVVTHGGATIGYIPRDCWLQDAIHDEGKGCDATIKEINSDGGRLGVVLDVSLNMGGVAARAFSRGPTPATTTENKGCFAQLFGL